MKICSILFALVLLCTGVQAQQKWPAKWITHPSMNSNDYTVLHFKNSFTAPAATAALPIRISADIRYKLYLNGTYIGQGPANNDLRHYSYDTYDLKPHLKAGENVLAVTVWSLGDLNPLRFESKGARLLVQSDNEEFSTLNTGTDGWKVLKNTAYSPTLRNQDFSVLSYYAMGGGEQIDASAYPWGWEINAASESAWEKPQSQLQGEPYGFAYGYGEADLGLSPRSIPQMDESEIEQPIVRTVTGMAMDKIAQSWNSAKALEIPANSTVTILLDQQYLTKGFPFYTFSGGKGATVEASYAETLFYPDGNRQGNRNEVEGKTFRGLKDRYKLDGGKGRTFSPLLSRTWRYLQLHITTGAEPVVLENYKATKFLYPFTENASFHSGEAVHDKMWEVGWRTARLCADETYMDCPYYEQLQYIGDTRIQALISLYVDGDDRLMRNAITQFVHSITDEGITQSRFPSSLIQYIPPYALFLVNMLHDFHWYSDDDAFTKQYLEEIAFILFWFESKLQEDNLMGPLPWWNYVDVTEGFERSSPPGSDTGGSVVLSLQYVYALQDAVALFRYHGKEEWAAYFEKLKTRIQQAVVQKAYNKQKGLFADTPEQNHYSQHANVLAILTNTSPKEEQKSLFERMIADTSLSVCNIYFRFYLVRAAQQTGHGDFFIENTEVWEDMLEEGLTTFAEHAKRTRSDCHAWSASPNFEFLHTVCGIQPLQPHFAEVLIAPNPGSLKTITGKMPHPKGEITVDYKFDAGKVSGTVSLPEGVQGVFRWGGKEIALKSGKNNL